MATKTLNDQHHIAINLLDANGAPLTGLASDQNLSVTCDNSAVVFALTGVTVAYDSPSAGDATFSVTLSGGSLANPVVKTISETFESGAEATDFNLVDID